MKFEYNLATFNNIRAGNHLMRETLVKNINALPEKWQKDFAESLKDLTDENNPARYLSDGSPFLTRTNGDEVLPF